MAGSPDVPSVWLNWAMALQPIDDADAVADAAGEFFEGSGHMVLSPWPTVDLKPVGYGLVGHPPLMIRPAGLPAPSLPQLDIRQVSGAAELAIYEQVFVEAYPVPEAQGSPPGTMFSPAALAPSDLGRLSFYLGYLDGEPVATSAAFVAHGVIEVEFVSALPSARGAGFGAGMTWAAGNASRTTPSSSPATWASRCTTGWATCGWPGGRSGPRPRAASVGP